MSSTEPKPLSGRLVNEQGVVTFILLEIEPSLDGYAVRVQEGESEYVGLVKLLEGKRTFKQFKEAVQDREDYLEAKEKYDAASDNMKASSGVPPEVPPVTVQINRTTHDAFALMQ